TERRSFGGHYRASLSGFFNRLTLEGTGYRERASDYLSSELETRVLRDVEDGALNLELDVTRKIAVFGGAEARRLRYGLEGEPPVIGLDVRRLDRTDGVARLGLRFGITPQFSLTAAVEGSQTVFDDEQEQELRDNRTFAYLGGLFYSRPRLFLNLTGGFREGRAFHGSSFREFSTATGSYFASYFLRRNLEARLYGSRRLVYGVLDSPYYFETRNGGGLNYQFRPRFMVRGFAEYGTNDYPDPVLIDGATIEQDDEATTFGGGFSIRFYRKAVLTALAARSRYTSNVPGRDRSFTRFTTGLTFQEDLFR
ncbi:MAG TPA: outer membrane beta-barrel protein, partial [Thermoanaerobaculia bacterium]|nr:outer membrane beta-barrel protein [Thermoanaerobaculia bacterium]